MRTKRGEKLNLFDRVIAPELMVDIAEGRVSPKTLQPFAVLRPSGSGVARTPSIQSFTPSRRNEMPKPAQQQQEKQRRDSLSGVAAKLAASARQRAAQRECDMWTFVGVGAERFCRVG